MSQIVIKSKTSQNGTPSKRNRGDEIVTHVYRTRQYSKFKFFPENRDPDHFKKMQAAITEEDLTAFNPIRVTKNWYIIEGQGTFLACKNLKKPVYYIRDETGFLNSHHISTFNRSRTEWKPETYLHHYRVLGNAEYKKVKAMVEETGFSVAQILQIWNKTADKKTSAPKSFQRGNYVLSEEGIEFIRNAHKVHSAIYNNWPVEKKVPSQRSGILGAVLQVLRKDISAEELTDKIVQQSFLLDARGNSKQYADLLLYIFNYKKSKNRKNVKA